MPSEVNKEIELEIAYVLFIDIVGYSKLVTSEQRRLLELLNEIVRECEHFRAAETKGRLITVPAGDGMALVFYNTPEAPVECALEVNRAAREHPELKLRMGIHSGPVSGVVDVSGRSNIAGAGINMAQRVMDCGDASHILVSKHMAEDLEQYGQWKRHLHDLGECEVKHGVRMSVVNLYTEEHGNPEVPQKFRQARKAMAPVVRGKKGRSWIIGAAVVLVAALIIIAALLSRRSAFLGSAATVAAIPEKSIAVLPFENLSRDPDNAYFADGMQDEILARLSKIADLKVISRTSTKKYKSAPDNLREIAKQLGVANILEGSAQKAADQVRVNVQLINALNDAHLWGDIYDRKLTDIFAVESDIAKTIADTLQAKLTGAEKELIAAQSTSDTTAYEFYLKGRSLWAKRGGDNIRQAIAFYEQAIARDPNYALAYAGLAEAYISLQGYTATAPQETNPKAKSAALKALQLDDKLAEAHTTLGLLLCIGDLDMVGSISEFQRAIALNPNYATAHFWYTFPLSAIARFDEAIMEARRAIELDPLSPIINANLGGNLIFARRYDEAIAQLREALEIEPTFNVTHRYLGNALQLKGDVPGAVAEYTKGQQLSDDVGFLVYPAIIKAHSGDKEAAIRMSAELDELSRHRYVRGYWRTLLDLSLGNRDEAIGRLERNAADHADSFVYSIKVDPMLDDLRGDPRFEALVQKVVGPRQK